MTWVVQSLVVTSKCTVSFRVDLHANDQGQGSAVDHFVETNKNRYVTGTAGESYQL